MRGLRFTLQFIGVVHAFFGVFVAALIGWHPRRRASSGTAVLT